MRCVQSVVWLALVAMAIVFTTETRGDEGEKKPAETDEKKAETEKQINTLNNKPHKPECIVNGHLPQGNLLPVICCPIVSVKTTIIIPITNPKVAAPLVIQGNQINPSKTIKN